jgi:hypothetical protein
METLAWLMSGSKRAQLDQRRQRIALRKTGVGFWLGMVDSKHSTEWKDWEPSKKYLHLEQPHSQESSAGLWLGTQIRTQRNDFEFQGVIPPVANSVAYLSATWVSYLNWNSGLSIEWMMGDAASYHTVQEQLKLRSQWTHQLGFGGYRYRNSKVQADFGLGLGYGDYEDRNPVFAADQNLVFYGYKFQLRYQLLEQWALRLRYHKIQHFEPEALSLGTVAEDATFEASTRQFLVAIERQVSW